MRQSDKLDALLEHMGLYDELRLTAKLRAHHDAIARPARRGSEREKKKAGPTRLQESRSEPVLAPPPAAAAAPPAAFSYPVQPPAPAPHPYPQQQVPSPFGYGGGYQQPAFGYASFPGPARGGGGGGGYGGPPPQVMRGPPGMQQAGYHQQAPGPW